MRIPQHKPPSRLRYEKRHPTISFRLDKDLKTRLKKVLEKESFASFVKEALGKREREKESIKNELREEYWQGFADGEHSARREFAVHAPCAICGKPFLVRNKEDKMDLTGYIISEGWCHPKCREAERKSR